MEMNQPQLKLQELPLMFMDIETIYGQKICLLFTMVITWIIL